MDELLEKIMGLLPAETISLLSQHADPADNEEVVIAQLKAEEESLKLTNASLELEIEDQRKKTNDCKKLLSHLKREKEYCEKLLNSTPPQLSMNAALKDKLKSETSVQTENVIEMISEINELGAEIKQLKAETAELEDSYKWAQGLPPSLSGAQVAVEELKKDIRTRKTDRDRQIARDLSLMTGIASNNSLMSSTKIKNELGASIGNETDL